MKKVLLIILILIVAIVLGIFGWTLITRDSNMPTGETLRDILPFGKGEDVVIPRDNTVEEELPEGTFSSASTAKLFKLSETPVAGMVAFINGTTTYVRYADRATGHIYDVNPETLGKIKITNTTLPKIYEAHFRADGAKVLYRSLVSDTDEIENLSLALTAPRATTTSQTEALHTVSATILRSDMDEVVVGSGDTIFYLLKNSSSIVSSTFAGTNTRTLFTSPFASWRIAPFGTNSLLVTTRASSNVPGFAYTLPTAGGSLTKRLGPLNALVTLADPLGSRIVYSFTENNDFKFFTINLADSSNYEIFPETLAEKCVWSTKNRGILFCGAPIGGVGDNEPDSWYKGITRFSDRIWWLDPSTDYSQLLAEPKKTLGVDMDVSSPKLTPNEDYLIFINRNDLSLWALKLE